MRRILLLACLALSVAGTRAAFACPADLDSSFGTGGVSDGALSPTGGSYDIAIDEDGRIVTVGSSQGKPTVFRYTAGGELDESFGDGGLVQFDHVGEFHAVAIDDDGDIVASGHARHPTKPAETTILVTRLHPTGEPDSTFSGDGLKTVQAGPGPTVYTRDLLIRSDGEIVIAGQAVATGGSWTPLLVFLRPSDGDVVRVVDGHNIPRLPAGIATSAVEVEDRAIVFSGITYSLGDTFLAKVTADGLPDPTFGRNGRRIYRSKSRYEEAWRLGKDDQGRLYVSGNTHGLSVVHSRIFVRRVLPDGERDLTYGNQGRRLLNLRTEIAPRGLAVTGDGEAIVPAWFVTKSDRSLVARLTPQGQPDETFGRGGIARYRMENATQFHHVRLQDDGRILVVGIVGSRPSVVRLEGGAGSSTCTPD